MGRILHSARAMKMLATVLLGVALAGIAVSIVANNKSVAIQGPSTLRAVDADTLWLSVDEQLWILDRQGRRTGVRNAADLGLTEAVSNIVPAPAGQVLLSSRGDRHWELVDRATLARVRTIRPQWPADLAALPLRAVHLAVSPEGDIAAATGGGHAVVLFDREGRVKARTAPDVYRFTNGLWWAPEGWWTTDTNRFTLHLLDHATLAVRHSLQLRRAPVDTPYLGEALASQGQPLPDTALRPFATLTRMGSLMEPGHVVDVFPDGSQVVFNRRTLPQLRDIAWFDGHLLAVDGEAFGIQRFDALRTPAAPFGDAQVQDQFARMHADRVFWRRLGSQYAWYAALALLVLGIAAYAWQRRLAAQEDLAARERGEEPPPVQSRTRKPGLPAGVAVAGALALMGALGAGAVLFVPVGDSAAQWTLLAVPGALALGTVVNAWRRERRAADPRHEEALNRRADEWLRADFDRIKLDSELPRESMLVPGWRPRWLLVTNRRILLFAAGQRRPASEWSRRAVLSAASPVPVSAWEWLVGPPNLAISFTTGTTLRVRCASTVGARRVAGLLMSSPALPEEAAAAPRRSRKRWGWHEVLASFVVPGTGQWLQGRFAVGVVLFTVALLLCIYGWAPVLWAMHGPKMDVSRTSMLSALLAWLGIALVASSDAWRFRAFRA